MLCSLYRREYLLPFPTALNTEKHRKDIPKGQPSEKGLCQCEAPHPPAVIPLCPHADRDEIHSEPALRDTDRINEVTQVRTHKKQTVNKAKSA